MSRTGNCLCGQVTFHAEVLPSMQACPGAKYLPANRADMQKGQRRQLIAHKSDKAALGADTTLRVEMLLEPEDDGLTAQFFTAAPDTTFSLPDASEGGGQYHVVIAGSHLRNGVDFPALSVEFASPEEGSVVMNAGPKGIELLYLRFPN